MYALPAGAQRIPARRPRQSHSSGLRLGERIRRQVQPALRRHQSVERRNRIRRGHHRRREVARRRFRRPHFLRFRILRTALRMGRAVDQGRQSLRLRSHRRASARTARDLDRTRQRKPLSQPLRRRKSGSIRAHEGRRVSRRRPHPARQDRHGVEEPQPARPHHVPYPARRTSPHRQAVVHLPDVRLRARPIGFDRRHHAFHLHVGIRRPPPPLRLVRRTAGHPSSAAD